MGCVWNRQGIIAVYISSLKARDITFKLEATHVAKVLRLYILPNSSFKACSRVIPPFKGFTRG